MGDENESILFQALEPESRTDGEAHGEFTVALVTCEELVRLSDLLPAHHEQDLEDVDFMGAEVGGRTFVRRNEMVASLMKACGVTDKMVQVIEPNRATRKQLLQFHDEEYLEVLENTEAQGESTLHRFGLEHDAAPFKHVYDHAALIAGATLTCADLLCNRQAKVAVNWCGGRHHAHRASASGFCFLNDVVLGALCLQKEFKKVFCIDIDVHHGDGTEAAFLRSDKVFTCSFHQYEPGFFPGSGSPDCSGIGKGEGFNLNVPFNHRDTGELFLRRFKDTISNILKFFSPNAIILVCGADALRRDPRGGLLLDINDICECVRVLKQLAIRDGEVIPLLVLGGGGYHFPDTAKCWTRVTSILADKEQELPKDIPEHEYFELYGPSWEL